MPNDKFYYVYLLVSLTDPSQHYTGFTADLELRLQEHNKGSSTHTSKYRPWRLETAVTFTDESKARSFEAYLKSHSGRAFATRHF